MQLRAELWAVKALEKLAKKFFSSLLLTKDHDRLIFQGL